MPLYGKVAGYRQPPSDPLAATSPRLSLTPSASGMSARSRGSGGEIWVDSQPNCDRDLVNALPVVQYDNSAIYGYMDEHKKAMIQQWVEGQARGGPSIPPSHLTGVDSLAWLQERAEEQAQGQYTALTQFKMASSSTSSCSSTPAVETQAVVEVERLDGEEHDQADPGAPASKEPSPRRDCELNLNLRSGLPPPPPLRGGRTEAERPEDEDCNSKASSGSRGSSRRSDVGTSTEGLPNSAPGSQSKPVFDTKLQDPYRAPRKVALPRASPEKIPGTRTLDELYQHCEQLVETLSQASEELKAKEVENEECLRVTGIDDIEIYSVEEGSEGSVEVSLVYPVVGSRQFLFLLSNGVRCSSDK